MSGDSPFYRTYKHNKSKLEVFVCADCKWQKIKKKRDEPNEKQLLAAELISEKIEPISKALEMAGYRTSKQVKRWYKTYGARMALSKYDLILVLEGKQNFVAKKITLVRPEEE